MGGNGTLNEKNKQKLVSKQGPTFANKREIVNCSVNPLLVDDMNPHYLELMNMKRKEVTTGDILLNAITIKLTYGNESWLCTGLYASPYHSVRPSIWNHLCDLSSSVSDPWLILGDFNEIISPLEQKGVISIATEQTLC